MSRARDLAGWIGAGTVTAGLFAGAAVAALRLPEMSAGEGPVVAVALDLSVGVIATAPEPVVEAAEDDVPEPVASSAQPAPLRLSKQSETGPVPPVPIPDRANSPVAAGVVEPSPLDLPVAATPPVLSVAAEDSVPSLDASPRPQARPERRPVSAQRTQAERPVAEQMGREARAEEQSPPDAETDSRARAAAQAAGAQQVARPAEERRAAGGQAAARYGDVVMRQIAGLRRQKAPERGAVTVGFEIDAAGGLRQVAVVVSSGSEALDRVAVEHIRRAAPFPPPPNGAMTRFAFEFVGR